MSNESIERFRAGEYVEIPISDPGTKSRYRFCKDLDAYTRSNHAN